MQNVPKGTSSIDPAATLVTVNPEYMVSCYTPTHTCNITCIECHHQNLTCCYRRNCAWSCLVRLGLWLVPGCESSTTASSEFDVLLSFLFFFFFSLRAFASLSCTSLAPFPFSCLFYCLFQLSVVPFLPSSAPPPVFRASLSCFLLIILQFSCFSSIISSYLSALVDSASSGIERMSEGLHSSTATRGLCSNESGWVDLPSGVRICNNTAIASAIAKERLLERSLHQPR